MSGATAVLSLAWGVCYGLCAALVLRSVWRRP